MGNDVSLGSREVLGPCRIVECWRAAALCSGLLCWTSTGGVLSPDPDLLDLLVTLARVCRMDDLTAR